MRIVGTPSTVTIALEVCAYEYWAAGVEVPVSVNTA